MAASSLVVPLLALAQVGALVVLVSRLSRGRHRAPRAVPVVAGVHDTTVSVVVPARNEAARIGPCLDGLAAQGAPMMEAIVVDGGSTDGTQAMIDAVHARDPRIRRMDEPPKLAGHVGRPWAIAAGAAAAQGEWVLVVDADAAPRPGMVAGAVAAAREARLDVASFAPRIVAPSAGAALLQPSFLTTLVYRFGPAGVAAESPERAMANGQCMLVRRAWLEGAGGYAAVSTSFCDDVAMARLLAGRGARVGMLDGPGLLDVTMYPTARETWRAWPRSLNMRDCTRPVWRVLDGLFLVLAQALPVPVLLLAIASLLRLPADAPGRGTLVALAAVNAVLVLLRLVLLPLTRHSFTGSRLGFWLSPLADLATVLRVVQTSLRPVREWRGAVAGSPSAATGR